MRLGFNHSYAQELPGFHAPATPAHAPAPKLLFWNLELAESLALPLGETPHYELAQIFSGNSLPDDANPIAQVYAGHQFGHFSPQLGDGRALLLGEKRAPDGKLHDLAFKGSGRTAFSRSGDGKAAVGPMLREVLIGEFLHAMGIPTTRALAVVATGEQIWREGPLPGAVLTRVASSHLRVGTFEFFALRGQQEKVKTLALYAIKRHAPQLEGEENPFLAFLRLVAQRQAALIAQWLCVGFVHGVMNTDNMALSGESIDFGPCAFLEGYDPGAVFSSIDHGGRYAYGNQASMARWNLARLCETFLPLLSLDPQRAVELANEVLEEFGTVHEEYLLQGMQAKLGLAPQQSSDSSDAELVNDWLLLLQTQAIDWTLAFRFLGEAAQGDPSRLRRLFKDIGPLEEWLNRWHSRCTQDDCDRPPQEALDRRSRRMQRANPVVIPRNHRVEEALTAATLGDLTPFETLLAAVRNPSAIPHDAEHLTDPAPAEFSAGYRTFCGT